MEYGLDLVFGWLSEDLILGYLQRKGIPVELAGEDRNREFLFPSEIGTTSDLLINSKGNLKPLEIVFSWNDYWKKTDRWDLRESKFKHLIRAGEESLCLGIELPSLQGFLVDMKNVQNAFVQRPNPAWGNKKSYTLFGMSSNLKNINLVLDNFERMSL
jgi:hypothetical protein